MKILSPYINVTGFLWLLLKIIIGEKNILCEY